MARKSKNSFLGPLYHVIVRGNKGQKVFRREKDFEIYLRLLGEYREALDFVLCSKAILCEKDSYLVELSAYNLVEGCKRQINK